MVVDNPHAQTCRHCGNAVQKCGQGWHGNGQDYEQWIWVQCMGGCGAQYQIFTVSATAFDIISVPFTIDQDAPGDDRPVGYSDVRWETVSYRQSKEDEYLSYLRAISREEMYWLRIEAREPHIMRPMPPKLNMNGVRTDWGRGCRRPGMFHRFSSSRRGYCALKAS